MVSIFVMAGVVFAAGGTQSPWTVAQPGRAAEIDSAAVLSVEAGDQLELMVPNATFTGTVTERVERSAGRVTISGEVENTIGGSFAISIVRGAMAAYILTGDEGWRLRADADGNHLLTPVQPMDLDCASGHVDFSIAPHAPFGARADDTSVVDVVVVYTHAARNDAGGVAQMEAEVDIMVQYNNVAFANSQLGTKWRLVHTKQLLFSSTPSLGDLTDPNDGFVDGVHDLRDAYGADQVALVVDGFGGVANGLWNLDPASADLAFCVNGLDAAPMVMSHEIGHNLGCCHAVGQGGGCPLQGGLLFAYSNGHFYTGNSGNLHGTVMAGGTLMQHFSNPDVMFDGFPTGIEEGAGGHVGADNVRTIKNSAATVASWRPTDDTCFSLDLPSVSPDCNQNEVPDACEIALGWVVDDNGNGVPDECDPCFADWNGDSLVQSLDVLDYLNDYNLVRGGGAPIFQSPDLTAPLGVLNTADFLRFLNFYNQGC